MRSIDPRIPAGVGSKKSDFSVPFQLIKHRRFSSLKSARTLTALILAGMAVCRVSSNLISALAQTSSLAVPVRSEETGFGVNALESKVSSDLQRFIVAGSDTESVE